MNACPVVTIQPSSAVTESPNSILVRRKAYPPSLFNGPTKDCQVNRPPRRIEELLPVKGSPPIRPLTICVSPDSFLGLERWEAHGVCHLPAGRLLGMVTSIWCRDRLPAMHSSNGPLFHAGSPTKTPPHPQPKIGCNITNGSDPEARQVMNTVLEFRPAESPISWPRGHINPRGNAQTEATPLQARRAHHFPCVFGPSGQGTVQTLVNP